MARSARRKPPEPDQLVIDLVPYPLHRIDPYTLELESEHFAQLLAVPVHLGPRGFWVHSSGATPFFVTVATDEIHGKVAFGASSRRVLSVDALVDWFSANLSGIYEVGYELLDKQNSKP